jgi:hypothetical protein
MTSYRRDSIDMLPDLDVGGIEPTGIELAAIEAEWPLIEAELHELDCVIRIVSADHDPDEMDIRRYRRAQRRVLREMRAFLYLTDADRAGVGRYRDNHAVRFALKCGNDVVSRAILGGDACAEGYDASALPTGKPA